MSKNDEKRQRIFDKYVSNRNLLIDNGFLEGEKDTYICPICLEAHKTIDGKDPLSLEDAPPKSLGGKSNTLTCKSCNNEAGHTIDFHLTERLRELDSTAFLPNTETKVKIKFDDQITNATINVDAHGKISMFHSKKNNHPIKLEEQMVGLKGGEVVNLEFLKTRVIPEKLEYALLKTAYILAFERFGNSIIYDSCFDIVREQLNNPDERIYPENFWFTPPYPKEMEGVYFVCDKGLESILVIFNLDTGNSLRKFGVFLPCPVNDIATVLERLNEQFADEKNLTLKLYPWEQDDKYLEDIEQIKTMHQWISNRKK
ncbi:hypothetical protein [Chryseobacterium sp. sg2396]|uniref:hypothetical protein n=1 Tax=Chryseobacterium sp. sg2396 TaxID=3276280 RepID=UPI0025E34EE0|nr:hypothetical protein [uncultured Chryseobacterium sp.]